MYNFIIIINHRNLLKKETQKCEINLSMYIYKLEANVSIYILDVNLPNRKTVETEISLKYIYIYTADGFDLHLAL